MLDLSSCPACNATTSAAHEVDRLDSKAADGTRLAVRLVECPECSHVFLNPVPEPAELAPFYESDYHVFADQLPSPDEIRRMVAGAKEAGSYNHAPVVPGGRYLDVGCGLGTMVASMAALGMEATGVEPSEIAVRRAREAGCDVHHGLLEEAGLPDETFDVVSMYHVLEHAPDPIALLRECRRVMKPDGCLVVGVPNYDSMVRHLVGRCWSALDPPRHLHHFRRGSLQAASERAGLSLRSVETESIGRHVQGELCRWLRRYALVPMRLTLGLGLTAPLANSLARRSHVDDRGEALVATFGVSPEVASRAVG